MLCGLRRIIVMSLRRSVGLVMWMVLRRRATLRLGVLRMSVSLVVVLLCCVMISLGVMIGTALTRAIGVMVRVRWVWIVLVR